MDNFDLKDYLGNNVLLEQDGKLDDILVQRNDILKTISVTEERELWDFLSKNSPIGFEKKLFIMDNFEQIRKGEMTTVPYNWLKNTYPDISKLTDKKFFGGLKNEKELEKATVDIHNKFFDFIKDKTGNELSIGRSEYDFGGAKETIGDLIQGAAEQSGESSSTIKGAFTRAKDSVSNFVERAREMWDSSVGEDSIIPSIEVSSGNPIIDRILVFFSAGLILTMLRFHRISKKAAEGWVNSQNDAMAAKAVADDAFREVRGREDHYKRRMKVNDRIGRFLRWFDAKVVDYIKKRKQNQKNESILFESLDLDAQTLDKINISIFKKVALIFPKNPVASLNFIADWFDGELKDNSVIAGEKLANALPKSKTAQEINKLLQQSNELKFTVRDNTSEQLDENIISNLASKVLTTSKETLTKLVGKSDDSLLNSYIDKMKDFYDNFTDFYDTKITNMIDVLEPSGWAKWVVGVATAVSTVWFVLIVHALKVINKNTKQKGHATFEKERASAAGEALNIWKRFGRFVDRFTDYEDEFRENKHYSLTKIVLSEQTNLPTEKELLDSFSSLTSYYKTDTAAMVTFINDLSSVLGKYALKVVSLKPREESITNLFDGTRKAAIKLQNKVEDKSKVEQFLKNLP